MIKHRFIVELNHQQGEYLAHHVFLLTATSKAEAMIVAEKSAQTWYGEGDNETTEDDDDHYFGCGEVCIALSQVE